MINVNISLVGLAAIFAEMGLPEPFVFSQRGEHDTEPSITGLITGWIKHTDDGAKYLDVDSMIVRSRARRKFYTMMKMSEDATQAAFREGCAYALISIREDDPRRAGLDAWARRMNYQPYATQDGSVWYVRFNPTYVYQPQESSDGQGRFASEASTTSGPAGS